MTIAWTLAGSDSGGGAGIQADLHTFHDFGVHGCSVITATTAQNSTDITDIHPLPPEHVRAQIDALDTDLPAHALKIGMLGTPTTVHAIADYLRTRRAQSTPPTVVFDPVLRATGGDALWDNTDARSVLIDTLLSLVDIITPNTDEARLLVQHPCDTPDAIEKAAHTLQQYGPPHVIITGGNETDDTAADYYCGPTQQFWLTQPRYPTPHTHGSGCSFSAALCAALALGYDLTDDALIIAKMYVTQGIHAARGLGKGPGPVAHQGPATDPQYLPYLGARAASSAGFPDCGSQPLGFYPIVDSTAWVKKLLDHGVTTLQLRIKAPQDTRTLEDTIKSSILRAQRHQARLFINDYWELALQHGAYGVHLGQEDLESANIEALQRAGLRLGISTHCHQEVLRARALRPSYMAIGPIYPTTSKPMRFAPQGIARLHYWKKLLPDTPLVAIGGITQKTVAEVTATGVDGIAVISALTHAPDPTHDIALWKKQCP